MANELIELQLQGSTTVYKVNDARISTTAVTTATHILTTNSGVTSIAPITAANLASVLGVAGIVFEKRYNTPTISMRFGVYVNKTHSITLLVTRCFYNIPTNLGIIMIGNEWAGFDMSVLRTTPGLSFSFEAASDGLNGIVTVTQNNTGNALGTLRISVLQRSSDARFTGEITGS